MAQPEHARELSAGELARRSGVAVSTVHFYEAKGLLESRRTEGNQRRYGRATLRRVAIIRIAQRAGISLAVIRESLSAIPTDRAPTALDWARMTRNWKAMLDEHITALVQLRDQMETCIGCGCLSLQDCPLRNPRDGLAADGPGPRLLLSEKPCPGDTPA